MSRRPAPPKKRRSGPSGPTKPHAEREGVRVDLRWPEDLHKRVVAHARRDGLSVSAFIRMTMDEKTGGGG